MTAGADSRPAIPGYTIRRPLAAGGMGSVYEAVHDTLDRRVAIKVLQGQFADDAAFADRFLREARIAARIDHPGVVTVHDAGRDADGHLYLAMGFVEGGDLSAWCREPSPLIEHDVLRIGRLCAEALAAIHAHGLIHRDIKPDNILMNPGGDPVITDLGLARSQHGDDRMTATGQIVGTPAYMSPEQANGSTGLDHRTDIYSLGATLFALLTGRPPFKGATPWATVAAIINEPAPDLRSLRAEVQPVTADLIARCLAKDPAARPSDAQALAVDLAACASSLEAGRQPTHPTMIAADPSPPPTSAALPALRAGWLPTVLAGGALVLIAGLIAALAVATDEPEPFAEAEPAQPLSVGAVTPEAATGPDVRTIDPLARNRRSGPKQGGAPRSEGVADPEAAAPVSGVKAGIKSTWSSAIGALSEDVAGAVEDLEPRLRAELLDQGLSVDLHHVVNGNAKIEGQIEGEAFRLSIYPIDGSRSRLVIESGFPRNRERQQLIRSKLDRVLFSP